MNNQLKRYNERLAETHASLKSSGNLVGVNSSYNEELKKKYNESLAQAPKKPDEKGGG